MGIPMVQHPRLSGQLGIFSVEKLDKRLISLFLERIPSKFKKVNIRLNKFVNIEQSDYNIKEHETLVIDLIRSTNGIYSKYDPKLKQTVDQALLKNLSVINALKTKEVVDFIMDDGSEVNKTIKQEDIFCLRRILSCMVSNHLGNVFGVYSGVNNLCALGLFLYSHNKISVPVLAVNEEGKENNAIELLIHSVIFNNVEKNVTLAYEDSPNKYFSEILVNFGAERKKFKEISKLHFFWPLNILLS